MTSSQSRPEVGGIASDLRMFRAISQNRIWRTRNSLSDGFNHQRRRVISRVIVFGPIGIFLFLAAAVSCGIAFGRAATSEDASHLLTSMFLITFTAAVAGCLSSSLQSLFLSSEVRFLATLPIPLRLIFFARFTDCAKGAVPGTLFGLAVCLGYLLGRAERLAFLAIGLPVVILLVATGVGLSALLTALVVRYVPPKRTRSALMLLSLGVLAVSTAIWSQYSASGLFGTDRSVTSGSMPLVEFTPPAWASRILLSIIGGNLQVALPTLLVLAATLVVICGFAARIFSATFAHNIERTELSIGQVSPRPTGPIARTTLDLVPRSTLHWVRREWTLVGRDFARLSAAIWPISAIVLYVATSLIWGGSDRQSDTERFWTTHGPLLFLPWGLSLGTTIFAIGSEAQRMGLIKSLPVSGRSLILGKLVSYVLPIIGASLAISVLAIAISPGSPRDNYVLCLMIVWLSISFCATDLAFSVAAPRFDSDHAQRSTSFWARIMSTLVGFMLVMATLTAAALSPLGNGSLGKLISTHGVAHANTIWIAAAGVAAVVPILLLIRASGRLETLLTAD